MVTLSTHKMGVGISGNQHSSFHSRGCPAALVAAANSTCEGVGAGAVGGKQTTRGGALCQTGG